MEHYTITPLEKKSISIRYEMYRDNDDGTQSWFNIDDHYRWGKGLHLQFGDVEGDPVVKELWIS